MSLDYDTWMRHMKKDYCSMRFSEKDAKVFYKRMVNKHSKELGKIMFQKIAAPGSRIVFIPAEDTITEKFMKKDSGDKNKKKEDEPPKELNSKRNFDLIRRRTEIRKK